MAETVNGICRSCAAFCPLMVDVEDGEVTHIIGDKHNPVYWGYSCIKGRQMVSEIKNPQRIFSSQKRQSDASFQSIDSGVAIDEIAVKLQAIIAKHGPRAVASYSGTFIFAHPATAPIYTAWMKAIGSPMMFTSSTIDQPGKMIAGALHGNWAAGPHVFDDADTWLLVGVNPIVAHSGGIPNQNPAKRLKDAVERGMKLLVIDPRRSECAQKAHVHLQPRAGEDPTVLAGMIRFIIKESLYDSNFIRDNTQGFAALSAAVEPFTPQYVEYRADVPAVDLIEAARVFAHAQRGGATGGTGTNMAPRGNLTEYLLLALMSICGRWMQAGERVPNPGVMGPTFEPRAQANPPYPAWGYGEQLRVRGFTDAACGLPTAALADEILLDGPGQVKALICMGGNPLMAWPDQRKTVEALKKLELFVCLDVQMANNSCHYADYVLACKHSLESPALTLPNEMLSYFGTGYGYSVPYAQYSPAVVQPPAGADLIEDWEFFYELARRMQIELEFEVAYSWTMVEGEPPKHTMDMQKKPTTDELYAVLCKQGRVPLDEVKKYPAGKVFDDVEVFVQPQIPNWEGRLQVGDAAMIAELEEVSSETRDCDRFPGFPYRMISRRRLDVFNSTGRSNPKQVRKYPYNPAYMHPSDLQTLELKAGDSIRVASPHDFVYAVVDVDEGLKPGTVSMSHCFGGEPNDEDDARFREIGCNSGRLTSVESEYDPYSGIPRMSAIPIRVELFEQV